MELNAQEWKAGVASVNITPEAPMWMAGYASRDHESEGVLVDLWAKALALEDAKGKQAVVITADLIGYRGSYMTDRIKKRLRKKYRLTDAEVILNCSHTHSGPELMKSPEEYFDDEGQTGMHSPEQREKIRRYSEKLEDQIVELVGKALSSSESVRIFSGNGVTRFAVNRRVNRSKTTVSELTKKLEGHVDHSVPVIKVEKSSGELLAVLFGYACHGTTLSIYKFSGDYPGFAQIELEKTFPGVTAMFFQGCGGDQNPLPRRKIGYARQYGKELAAAVEAVVSEPMRELSSNLSTAYSKVNLEFANPTPTQNELMRIIKEDTIPGYLIYQAKVLLNKLKRGETLMTSYPYPVQFWKIGEQNMVIMGGEVVIDYAIKLKQIFGDDLFVMGYANEMMGYIPSTKVLSEGGYEATRSPVFTTPWAPTIEMKIILEVIKLAQKVGAEYSLSQN